MDQTKHARFPCSEVHLHGWDAQSDCWHGPIPLATDKQGARLTAKVRAARGGFQGTLRCSVPGLPCLEFHTVVYDLHDVGVALIHMEGVRGGPVGILAALPRGRRQLLRADFPFELMTVLSFLGSPINRGSELAIHDYIEEVLRTGSAATEVFAVEMAELSPDTSIVLSAHFEHLAAALLDWMARREPAEAEPEQQYVVSSNIPRECVALTAASAGV